MKTNFTSPFATGAILAFAIPSCVPLEDPGALIEERRTYEVAEFNRLDMGSAFVIDVAVGEAQSITIKGDRRNLNDLIVAVENQTLKIEFDEYRNRRHRTYITITIPDIEAVNFSGASTSTVSGISTESLDVIVSGASKLTLNGVGDFLNSEISGASRLYALNYQVKEVHASVSGASKARYFVLEILDARASGASYIGYKGDPVIYSDTSGASVIRRE